MLHHMFKWESVLGTALWVIGLAFFLAACSFAYWQAVENRVSYRQALLGPGPQRSILAGLTLVGAGLAVLSRNPLQLMLAGLLMVLTILGQMRIGSRSL